LATAVKIADVLLIEHLTFQGCRFAIGIRNAHDKSMRLAMTVDTAYGELTISGIMRSSDLW
jgi:hypothetical protein